MDRNSVSLLILSCWSAENSRWKQRKQKNNFNYKWKHDLALTPLPTKIKGKQLIKGELVNLLTLDSLMKYSNIREQEQVKCMLHKSTYVFSPFIWGEWFTLIGRVVWGDKSMEPLPAKLKATSLLRSRVGAHRPIMECKHGIVTPWKTPGHLVK